VVTQILEERLRANKGEMLGFWQVGLNHEEHYRHGFRDCRKVQDMMGDMWVDYTLFGFENEAANFMELTGCTDKTIV
jgi:hypothetical protein